MMDLRDGTELLTVSEASSPETTDSSPPEAEQRVTWDNKAQYLLSLIGFAVGVGNVWRFPYLCQVHGGGAFLIPYFIMLFLEGLPLVYLELSLGHRFRSGTVGTWRQVSPALTGIGIAMNCTSYIVGCYYIIVMVWSLFYLFNSFHDPLPWMTCNGVTGTTMMNGTEVKVSDICNSSTSKFFWYNTAVQASSDIEHPGKMIWQLALCLILAWVILFVCLVKGIKSSGKAVYVTAVFPYVSLIILFFRGVTLQGAGKGIAFLFTPDWSKLYDPIVWLDAASQIFFSLSVAFGALITYTSYTDPNAKSTPLKDTLTVSFVNCGTSLFASIVIFSVLGFKAEDQGIDVKDVASGPGLAFIAFSEALGLMPGAPFWSVLFFLTLIALAVDSMFGTIEVLLTDILDELEQKWQFITKSRVLLALCFSGLLVGLVFVLQSGYYTFQLFNTFSITLPLLVIALCECIAVAWVYGAERFGNDMERVTGRFPQRLWLYMWKYVSPLVVSLILVGSIIAQGINPINYNIYHNYTESGNGQYPPWALFCASLMIFIIIGPIPVRFLLYYIQRWRTRNGYLVQTDDTLMGHVTSAGGSVYRSLDDTDSN